jgi:hypothetical protein
MKIQPWTKPWWYTTKTVERCAFGATEHSKELFTIGDAFGQQTYRLVCSCGGEWIAVEYANHATRLGRGRNRYKK